MKNNLWTKALSALLAFVMVVGMIPATTIAAFADGVPETLVTSLTELYSGDETHAREDLEALSAAGLLGDDGKLVDLDIREGGESVELSALAERIANGETVGEITVNGNAATAEQIVQISQVKAAIEIAELLDEEIDVTDEHVENLENLLTGIQNGNVDLENALKTGALSLKSTAKAPLLGAGNDGENALTISGDGKHYIGRYVSGSESNASYEFDLDTPDDTSYYTDPQYSGYVGGSNAATTAGTISFSFPSINHDKDNYSTGYLQINYSKYWPYPITVTATLDQAQPYPVSFDWKFSGGNNSTTTPGGTVTWKAGESGDKTFDLFFDCPNTVQNHIGKAGYQFNASNISNALFEGGKKTYTRNITALNFYLLNGLDTEGGYWFNETKSSLYGGTYPTSVAFEGVYSAAGTYYPGEILPVTVKFDKPVAVDENTTITVNGSTCNIICGTDTESKDITFGYVVKENDAAQLNVTAVSGFKTSRFANPAKGDMTVNNFTEQSITPEKDQVYIGNYGKTESLDLENAVYGIDDGKPGSQIVTVLIPLKDTKWLLTEMTALGKEMQVELPGYDGKQTIATYLSGTYFSYDKGATRYPAYVVEADGKPAIYTRFVAPVNTESKVRMDTVELYMDTLPVAGTSTDYLPEIGEIQESNGFFYFSGSGKSEAHIVPNGAFSYLVKAAFFFDSTAYTTRTQTYETAEKGFIKLTVPEDADFPYLYPGDPEHPENQYDVEMLVTAEFYEAFKDGVVYTDSDDDYRFSYQISSRNHFSFVDPDSFTFHNAEKDGTKPDTAIATMPTVADSMSYDDWYITVENGGGDKQYDMPKMPAITVQAGLMPFLTIPRSSRVRETLTGIDTDVFMTTNISEQNKISTMFHASLYRISEDQILQEIPDSATPLAVDGWGEFYGTPDNPVTAIKVPGTALDEAGAYAVKISVEFNDGRMEENKTFTATAYLKVKQGPATVEFDSLESYYVSSGEIPEIGYSLHSAANDAIVYYTVQKSGSNDITKIDGNAAGGNINYTFAKPEGLKDAYTITVYARNKETDPWSVDSMLLTVYNTDVLKLIVKEVAKGTIGGTTGGTGDSATETTMDNTAKITEMVGAGSPVVNYTESYDSFQALRADIGLQKVISANYGSGVWGAISDRMEWKSADRSKLNVKYEQGGFYSDIENYSYTSYSPASDFLLVGTEDADSVKVTAKHAKTGMTANVTVKIDTLKNELYMFQFYPKVATSIVYKNGKGVKRELTSGEDGTLVVYEPDGGIGSNVSALSKTEDGVTYVGTIYKDDLVSGEKDIASLQLYPCNNLVMHDISKVELTFIEPDGKLYSGDITFRAGVYKNGIYCPTALIKTSVATDSGENGREDVPVTAEAGKVKLWFDPTQFKHTNEDDSLGANDTVSYVFEYRFAAEQNYQPGYVIINPASNDPADSIVNLHTVSGSRTSPQIIRQDYQQYLKDLNGLKATDYQRNVLDSKDNIGISPNFPKSVLYTVIALPGENVTVGEQVAGNRGYSIYENSDAIKFAFYPTGNERKLTGQTDISSSNVTAAQITDLSQINDKTTYFVFPFSSMPMLRSTYVMTNDNLTYDGITDEGENSTPTARIKAVITRGDMTVASMNMPFGVSNLSHQPDLNSNQGATTVGKEVRSNLKESTDIGAIFRSINVNDMIRKGFVFLGNLAGAGGDNPINLMILPTQDPATFRIIAFVGANQRSSGEDEGLSVNFNSQDLAEDMSKFKKEMEELNKKKDDENDSGGEGSMQFNFYGTIILEARVGIADGKWNIAFRGGNVGTNVKGKYEWGQTFFCGPYPAFVSFEVGFHADLEVAFGNKNAVRAMLLDAALGVSVEAFAGLGFDLSIVALQLGIYGAIGADVNFLLLTSNDVGVKNGTKLTISGEIGLKLKVKLLFISYTSKFASTGFNWTKYWGDYKNIDKNVDGFWKGTRTLKGLTKSGRAYTMYLFDDGSTIVEIDSGAELENRDYLELAERRWNTGSTSSKRLFKAAGPITDEITDIQTNSYPYSHPAFTDDGELFLYISDNDNGNDVQSVVSYAVKSGDGYTDMKRVDTSTDNVLADLDVVASGTKNNAFAAWIKQVETPQVENSKDISNSELGMMFSATEIYAGRYNGTAWTTTQLTDNYVADMSPTVASYNDKAIVAWRSMSTSALTDDIVNNILINEDFESGELPSDWKLGKPAEGKDTKWGIRTWSNSTTDNYNENFKGSYILSCVKGAAQDADDYLYLPVVDLRNSPNPRLSLDFYAELGDGLAIEYSTDGGETWGALSENLNPGKKYSYYVAANVDLPKEKMQIRFKPMFTRERANDFCNILIDNVVLNLDYTADVSDDSADKTDEISDITAMFNVENNINYRLWNGSEWTEAKVAYNGTAGTVNAIDSAMLNDGTSILVYTVRTGDDVTSTETFYTVIDANGNAVTTGRLTNDSYTDTNAQVTAVNDTNGSYFVLGWYSEHDAGEGMTSEYDDEGNATEKAVVAHDIRLARINKNGSYDIDFPESIGGTGETGISSDFHFSAPANNTDLANVSIVWSQKNDSDKAENAGKYELNAVRFFKADGVTGLTAPTDIATTAENYTIDRFDTYTDSKGAIHAIILGTDYSTIGNSKVYDTIDLSKITEEMTGENNAEESQASLEILDGTAISSLKLAKGTFPETAADVSADINISDVIPGFTTPVQFTVTNTGTGKLETVTAQVGAQSKNFTVNLLPNQSATLLMSYNVPAGAVADQNYTVKSGDTELGSGTLALNRPDVGISGIKLLQEHDGVRDIQVTLSNGSEIPLAGSGKTVKLAFYKDPFHEKVIKDSEVSITGDALAEIDAGTYTTVRTLNVTDIAALVNGEIPEDGVTVYARAWVADTEEPNTYNNDNYISFTGLLARNNGEKLTMDTTLEVGDGSYTVYADIRNNSMQETNIGTPVALLKDSTGAVIAQKHLQENSLTLTKEKTSSLSATFAAGDLNGKTPAEATVGTVYTVSFDLNGGSCTETIDSVQTNIEGHITLPTTIPTKTVEAGQDPLFFCGWYTAQTGGDLITADYTFTGDTTVYAHYVNHEHDFTYSADGTTITATCKNEDGFCYLPEEGGVHKATLTIAAPDSNTYTGEAIAAKITDANGIQGSAKVLYAAKGEDGNYGAASEAVPVNAGTYRASITLGTGEDAKTVSVDYNIENADLTNVSASQNGTLTYTGEAQTPQVTTAATAVNNQTVTFKYSLTEEGEYGTMPTFTDANEGSPATVYFKASAPNHSDATGSFTVTVNRATPNAPAAPTTENISASSVTLNAVDGCEYSMDGNTWQESTIFTSLNRTTEYTFYQRLKETANTNASPASSAKFTTSDHDHNWGNFTADGATITATCGNADTFHSGDLSATMTIAKPTLTTYGQTGDNISAVATVTNNIAGINTPTIVYKQGDTVLDAAPTAAGTYTASITLAAADIGQESDVTASVTYIIEKASITPSVSLENWTYGDIAKTPLISGNSGNGAVTTTYKLKTAEDTAYAETVPTAAGTYTVKISIDETDNYKSGTAAADFTINQKALTITADAKSKTYGEADPALTYTHSDLVGSDTITGELSRAEGENVNTYAIGQGTLTAGDNYTITYNGANLTINQKALTSTADSDEKVYDAEALTKNSYTNTGLAFNDAIESVTITGSQTVKGESNNVPSAAVIKQGEVNITANYNITYANGTLKVTAKPITITADSDTKVYDATALTKNSYSNTDLAAGDIFDSVTITGTQTDVGTSNNVPSAAVIKHNGTDVTASYAITYENGTLEVTPKAVTITANDKTKVYDGTALTEGGFTATELASTDKHTFTVAMTAGSTITNFGTQPNVIATVDGTAITTGAPTAVGNYLVTTVEGTLSITKLEIKGAIVKLDAFEYDTEVPNAEFINDSNVDGANGTIVQGDSTKTVTYYYQATAFLKSQTDAILDYYNKGEIEELELDESVFTELEATTFEPGKHYVLAVISGDNYTNTYITQSVFEVTKNTEKVRTAPAAPTVDGTKVTVDEADREKSLQYSLDDGTTWKPVTLNDKGEFTVEWATLVSNAALLLREAADDRYEKPSANATGTAAITTTTFTVTYDANGGINAPDAVTVTSDRTVTASGKANMTRKGYTFTGWNTKADGTGTDYEQGVKLTNGTTLYAQWEANTYKVRFSANGGKGTMEELEFTYDADKALTANAFERELPYKFLGWSLTANGGVQYQDKQSVKNLAESGTVILYAVWAKDLYNVSGTIKSAQTGAITLRLVQGNNTFGEEKTVAYNTANDETEFTLNGVPAGIYNLVATQGEVTMTKAVIITDDHVALELITMPSGNASSVIEVKSVDTPAVVVGGLDTLAELEEIDGRKVKVAMAIEAQNEAQAGEAGEAIVKESRAQNAEFIDFTVTKTITNKGVKESVEKMNKTNNVLELVIPFNFSGKTGIKLYRFHDGVEALKQAKGEEVKDGTYTLDQKAGAIHVYASKFSTYAITYSNFYPASDFAPTIAETEHGTITVEPQKAQAGKEVVITATPDAGYKLGELTVTDGYGKKLELTENEDGTYTFKQPNGKVTIEGKFIVKFVDVPENSYYAKAVDWAVLNGITTGVNDTHFAPDASCTRAQAVTFLWRALGCPEPTATKSEFTDVAEGAFYFKAVLWAAENGVTNGYGDGKFGVNDTVNRAQMVTFMERAMNGKAKTAESFTDVPEGAYYADAAAWAKENGISEGIGDNKFGGEIDCLRAQIVTMLYRYFVK